MKVKLTDHGKKHVADILTGVLIEAQQLIQDYTENNPAKGTDGLTVDFSQPTCHLITQKRASSCYTTSNLQVADSLSGKLSLISNGTIYFKPCLVFPVEFLGSDCLSARDIVAKNYGKMVSSTIRPAVQNYFKQLNNTSSIACRFSTGPIIGVFRDAGLPYTEQTHLILSISFNLLLPAADYSPVR